MRCAPASSVATKNPVQLQACPWCDEPLDHRNYALRESSPPVAASHVATEPATSAGGLPVFVVDEDLYDDRPTLVIGTRRQVRRSALAARSRQPLQPRPPRGRRLRI